MSGQVSGRKKLRVRKLRTCVHLKRNVSQIGVRLGGVGAGGGGGGWGLGGQRGGRRREEHWQMT